MQLTKTFVTTVGTGTGSAYTSVFTVPANSRLLSIAVTVGFQSTLSGTGILTLGLNGDPNYLAAALAVANGAMVSFSSKNKGPIFMPNGGDIEIYLTGFSSSYLYSVSAEYETYS